VAQAHLAAAERGRQGENYLLPGIDATFGQVLSIIGELLDKPVPKRELPMPLMSLVSRFRAGIAAITGREPELTPEAVALMTNEPRISSTKAARELGFRVVPLRVMLEDSYRWLKEEGMLT
jgi:nucleoside-diphosphate-sugar epimerase